MNFTIECIFRIILACLCGYFIGVERTKRLKEAGVRTHSIIAAASALIMIISKYGFSDILLNGNVGVQEADAARLAAGVISGISFIGAGVIYKNGNSVKGLTTAAGIWATSVIGLAIGGGMYVMGLTLTTLVVIIQILFHRFSIGADVYSETDVTIEADLTDKFREQIFSLSQQKKIQIISMRLERNTNGKQLCTISIRPKMQQEIDEIYDLFSTATDIHSIIYKY